VTTPYGAYPAYDPYSQASSLLPYSTQGMIPGYAIGAWGMTVNTSQLNFASQTSGGGMFGYSGSPSAGNLYFSLAAADGTDQFGNTYGAGLNVAGGTLATVSLIGAIMDATTLMQGSTLANGSVLTPVISGGTAVSLVHTMTNGSGQVLGYTQGATAVTFATNGLYLWTVPTGVNSLRVQAWGAGSGGSGGTATQGGEGGGGGEYSEEPLYGVNPGTVYVINVGQGGAGAITGQSGNDGGDTSFAPNGFGGTTVLANGATGGSAFTGGPGGTGSSNTIHFDGGNGANGSGLFGGNGGGSSGGTTNQGNPGVQSAGNAGGSGGAAPLNGGVGGGGGASDLNGIGGGGPGGGGGGAGAAVVNSHTKTYVTTGTWSYFGADSLAPNQLRQHGGGMYTGFQNLGSFGTLAAGNQFAYFLLPFATIQSDLAGVTVTSVSVVMKSVSVAIGKILHSQVSYSNAGAFGAVAPTGVTSVQVTISPFTVGKVTTINVGRNGNIGTALQNGNAKSMKVGPIPSSLLTNQAYWGTFDSGEAGESPRIVVNYYTGSAVVTAGNGADGQVILSYNPSVPTLNLAIASVSSTDAYGYTFGPGFTGGQFNLVGSAVPPSANAGTSSLSANLAGTPLVSLPSGYSGLLGSAQVDTTPHTVTQAAQAQLTNLWNIQAGDPQVNTVYRLTASGYGTWGSTQQTLQSIGCIDLGNVTGGGGVGRIAATAFAISTPVCWRAVFEITVVTTGTGGTVIPTLTFWISANAAGISPGTAAVNSIVVVTGPNNTLTTFNTTISHTMEIESLWGSTTGAPTITCLTSSFERLGA